MGDKVPIETYNQICRDLDMANKTIKEMKIKYEIPGQRCNAGHLNGLPIKLWDCPICTELLNECIQELQRENKMYRNQINI